MNPALRPARIFPALVLLLSLTLSACGPSDQQGPTTKTLNLFIWEEYLDPSIKADFEQETGIRVVEANFGSNEDMLAKLQAGGGFDLVVPSDYMVQVMRRMNLLEKLDHSRLPNLAHIDPFFRQFKYDPEFAHSIPFQWSTTGIGYNTKLVKKAPTSWADLLEPTQAAQRKGRFSMLNDPREALAAALLWQGFSPNTLDPTELARAEAILRAQKPFVAKYDSESFEDSLASGETAMAHGWGGEFAVAQTDNPDIAYVLPKEGAIIFIDNLAIPASAKNREGAYLFINYLLRPEVAAKLANYSLYGSANIDALPMIDEAVKNGPGFHRPNGIKLFEIEDLEDNTALYEKIWDRLKAE